MMTAFSFFVELLCFFIDIVSLSSLLDPSDENLINEFFLWLNTVAGYIQNKSLRGAWTMPQSLLEGVELFPTSLATDAWTPDTGLSPPAPEATAKLGRALFPLSFIPYRTCYFVLPALFFFSSRCLASLPRHEIIWTRLSLSFTFFGSPEGLCVFCPRRDWGNCGPALSFPI